MATFEAAVAAGLVDIDSEDRLTGEGFDVGTLPSLVDADLRRPPGRLGYPALDPLPDGPVWRGR
ncbi:hypothetical protein ACIQPS_36530 [Streptomyces sp. NPDC091290]|uniref:hypothetical protein n=1 Tax=Streptomyces sp. NPDC091290 TaxID=3365990 RepID=UPI0037FB37CE